MTETPTENLPVSITDDQAVLMMDGIENLISLIGTKNDRNSRNFYYVNQQTPQQIEAAYRGSWLVRKVHDIVPFEMTRAGRIWQTDDKDRKALAKIERKFKLWKKIGSALSTARLYGGAAILLGVRQGMPDQALRMNDIRKNMLQYAVVVSRHQLTAPRGMQMDPLDPWYGQPEVWGFQGAKGSQVTLHPSRVITFHGAPLPAGAMSISSLEQFWGDPLLLSIQDAVKNADLVQAGIASLIHELKQDVVRIPGLTAQLATTEGEAKVAKRMQAASELKSMLNALLLDAGNKDGKGGEEWETRQINFAQHPELIRQFITIVAGASDTPVTRLLGEAPGGLQSTGKGEERDFNRMIDAKRENDLRPSIEQLDEIMARSALGDYTDDIEYEFGDLNELGEVERSEVDKRNAETAEIYQRTATVPSDALAVSVQRRMTESGNWPGLKKALEESKEELGAPAPADPTNDDEAEQNVAELERRGAVGRDMAIELLADAKPRTLYVSRKLLNATEFLKWAKAQGFTETTPAKDLHVTVLFTRDRVDWMKAHTDWNEDEDGNLTIPAGGARIVEPLGDKGGVVLLFNATRLSWRHEQLKREVGCDDRFPEYQPHVTITYEAPEGLDLDTVEPYTGALKFGPEKFEEVEEDWRPK